MLPIHIDLTEVIEEFALTGDQAKQLGTEIIDRVVSEYATKWENLVNKGLKKTRSLYKRAMYVQRESDTSVVFGLKPGDNGLALAIEDGKPPFDEKTGFAASAKRKIKVGGGWYLTIPFRYASAGALAESTLFSGVLPKEVYEAAKNAAGRPLKTSQLPSQYQQLGKRKEIQTAEGVIPEYVHKAPKFQGLVRIEVGATQEEKRGGYFTFRRVSDKSEPLSWIHPGFEARKFMDKALDESQVEKVADMAIDEFLKQI